MCRFEINQCHSFILTGRRRVTEKDARRGLGTSLRRQIGMVLDLHTESRRGRRTRVPLRKRNFGIFSSQIRNLRIHETYLCSIVF